MKRGDKIPVTIAGQTVTNAEVREVGDGQVTLVVPGTLVVMATRTEIAYEAPSQDNSGTETLITGVDRSTAEEPVQSATVGENQTNDNNPPTQEQSPAPAPEVSTVENAEASSVPETSVGESPADAAGSPDAGTPADTGNEA